MRHLELLEHTDTVNELLARYGVKFGIYKNNVFHAYGPLDLCKHGSFQVGVILRRTARSDILLCAKNS